MLPSSGKEKHIICWTPYKVIFSYNESLKIGLLQIRRFSLPEDGSRAGFRNVVLYQNKDDGRTSEEGYYCTSISSLVTRLIRRCDRLCAWHGR